MFNHTSSIFYSLISKHKGESPLELKNISVSLILMAKNIELLKAYTVISIIYIMYNKTSSVAPKLLTISADSFVKFGRQEKFKEKTIVISNI